MAENKQQPHPSTPALSRRAFVCSAIAAGAGVLQFARSAIGQSADAPTQSAAQRPRVVRVRGENVFDSRGVHEAAAQDMVEGAIQRLTGAGDPAAAWNRLLRRDDVIALKFNRSGASQIATSDALARVLVRSLGAAGFQPDRIMGVELPAATCGNLGIRTPPEGWTTEVDFGSGRDALAAWLEAVTAIINVPFLKHHNIAGFTCCLKNLSHAVVQHPARFHANGCSPFIGDIVALPAIRSKLRLHLVNGLRGVFDRGPEAQEDFIWDGKFMLAGLDPVAVDCIALDALDEVRATLNLPPVAVNSEPPPYLAAANRCGLGEAKLYKIELERMKL